MCRFGEVKCCDQCVSQEFRVGRGVLILVYDFYRAIGTSLFVIWTLQDHLSTYLHIRGIVLTEGTPFRGRNRESSV